MPLFSQSALFYERESEREISINPSVKEGFGKGYLNRKNSNNFYPIIKGPSKKMRKRKLFLKVLKKRFYFFSNLLLIVFVWFHNSLINPEMRKNLNNLNI